MDTKEITVSDLAREQIRNAERLFPLIREKTEERKEKKTIISVSGVSGVVDRIGKCQCCSRWCIHFLIMMLLYDLNIITGCVCVSVDWI